MSDRKKDSIWYSTPKEARNRKCIGVTLPDAVHDKLERMAKARDTSRSRVIESLIVASPVRATGACSMKKTPCLFATEKVDTSLKKRPLIVAAAFCPFCGKKLPETAS